MATVDLPQYDLYVAGGSFPPANGRFYDTRRSVHRASRGRASPTRTRQDVERAVGAARTAFEGEWGAMTGFQRSRLMHRLADLIERDADRLAELESRDSGKLLREFSGQMRAIPAWYRYFAGLGGQDRGREHPVRPAELRRLHAARAGRRGRGDRAVELAAAAADLEARARAGRRLHDGRQAERPHAGDRARARQARHRGGHPGRRLQRHHRQRARRSGARSCATPASTRSRSPARRRPASTSPRAPRATSRAVTLELGGKSAQVVFPDADLDAAANGVIAGVFAATGQTCMAGSRLIVHEDVHDELIERVAERARDDRARQPARAPPPRWARWPTGSSSPRSPGSSRRRRAEGATAVCGGGPDPELGGYFVQPTILTERRRRLAAVREEIFGPVVAAMRFTRRGRGDRARPTTPSTASPARCGRSTSAARCGSRQRCAPAPSGSTPTASSARTCPSAASGPAASAARTGSTCCASTPRRKSVWIETSGATRDPFTLG